MIILPKLNFEYTYFNKYIDSETMEIHYSKHHASYVNNINNIFNNINFKNYTDNIKLISNLSIFPKKYLNSIKNNLGGHINHSIFWNTLGYCNNISYDLKESINFSFGNFNLFKNFFELSAINHFGSGWVWLIYNKRKKLSIISTNNQDNPIMGYKFTNKLYGYPILGLDLWEHAYYLKYKNNKIDYIKSFWNIINWTYINSRLLDAKNYEF